MFHLVATAPASDWLKFKNPAGPAVRREQEEDWGKGRRWRRLGPPSPGA